MSPVVFHYLIHFNTAHRVVCRIILDGRGPKVTNHIRHILVSVQCHIVWLLVKKGHDSFKYLSDVDVKTPPSPFAPLIYVKFQSLLSCIVIHSIMYTYWYIIYAGIMKKVIRSIWVRSFHETESLSEIYYISIG